MRVFSNSSDTIFQKKKRENHVNSISLFFHFIFPRYRDKLARLTETEKQERKERQCVYQKRWYNKKRNQPLPSLPPWKSSRLQQQPSSFQVLSLLTSLSHYFPFKQATNNKETRNKFVCFLFLSLLSSLFSLSFFLFSFSFLSLFFLFLSLSFSLSFLSFSFSFK